MSGGRFIPAMTSASNVRSGSTDLREELNAEYSASSVDRVISDCRWDFQMIGQLPMKTM
jgi:hypothetical protein